MFVQLLGRVCSSPPPSGLIWHGQFNLPKFLYAPGQIVYRLTKFNYVCPSVDLNCLRENGNDIFTRPIKPGGSVHICWGTWTDYAGQLSDNEWAEISYEFTFASHKYLNN